MLAKGFMFFSYSFGFFSPFPHGTRSLSNHKKGLFFESGFPIFKQNSHVPFYFSIIFLSLIRDFYSFCRFFQIFLKKRKNKLFNFAHHYFRNLLWFFPIKLLRCFTSLFFFISFMIFFHYLREFSLWKDNFYHFYFLYLFVSYTSIFYDLGIPLLLFYIPFFLFKLDLNQRPFD